MPAEAGRKEVRMASKKTREMLAQSMRELLRAHEGLAWVPSPGYARDWAWTHFRQCWKRVLFWEKVSRK